MDDLRIERSGSQEAAKLSIGLSPRELALLSLALDMGASESEASSAAWKFVQSLRARNVIGSDFESLLELPEPEAEEAAELIAEAVLDHFQTAGKYVLSVS